MNTRRDFFRYASAGTAALVWSPRVRAKGKRPTSILLILADDMSPDLSCLGARGVRTPHLDALAKRGMLFTRAYSSCASCSPSRASILTGMWPHACGIFHNVFPIGVLAPEAAYRKGAKWRGPRGVQENIPTAPELLGRAGYFTGITQKLHVGPGHKFRFDYRSVWRYTLDRTTRATRPGMYQGTREFLAKAGDRPFFLFANITLTHRPYQKQAPDRCRLPAPKPADVPVPPIVPDVPEVREDLAMYYGTVQMTDAQASEILAALRDAGRSDDTLVIFSADHGFPYHRAKATAYHAGVHVPLIVAGPGVRPGRKSDALVSLIDLLPTMLSAAGAPKPEGMQGRSLAALLSGKGGATGREVLFAEHNSHGPNPKAFYPSRAAWDGRYRYIRNLLPNRTYKPPADLVGGGPWKNAAFGAIAKHKARFPAPAALWQRTVRRPAEELYDIQADPWEQHNLLARGAKPLTPQQRAALTKLRRAMDQWMKTTKDRGAKLM